MNPRYDFTGQVALVTGGSSGMGLATVEAFAEGGAAVVLADVNEEALRAATDELTLAGHQALGMLCDVSQEDQVAAMVERAVAKFGRLDMAFNNAGVQAPPADAAEPTERGQQHHPHRFGRATRLLFRLPTHLYDWHLGWLFDGRFLRLTHTWGGDPAAATKRCLRWSAPTVRPRRSRLCPGSDLPPTGSETCRRHRLSRLRSAAAASDRNTGSSRRRGGSRSRGLRTTESAHRPDRSASPRLAGRLALRRQ